MKGISIPVLDKGYVQLVDYMGNDRDIVAAARVSYGEAARPLHDDEGLIRYLMRHFHETPFEMCDLKLRVRLPMDVGRQWMRHRQQSYNEVSSRYSVITDEKQKVTQWRSQSVSNKQGSSGLVEGEAVHSEDDYGHGIRNPVPLSNQDYLSIREKNFHIEAEELYQERLTLGVAKEQARKDLPLCTYTTFYCKANLRNWLHFLGLRCEAHAQEEIRAYANVIGYQFVKVLFPLTWQAFVDYRLESLTLSRLDIMALRGDVVSWPTKREETEFLAKKERLTA